MFDPPYGKPWLLYGLLGCSLALNLVMVLERGAGGESDVETASVQAVEVDAAAPVAAAGGMGDGTTVAPVATGASATTATAASASGATPVGGGWNVVTGVVDHSLARTFQAAAGDDGDALAAVFARLFVWDLDLRRDLQRGDRVEVAWRRDSQGTVEILAARLHSGKMGRTLAAYRWQGPGDTYTSYYQEDGTEVPFRLNNSPIQDYEQVTSLLKDRPTHAGMDFKTPVGTPITAPFAGTVTRTNWKWTGNGNCVEVRFADGAVAKLLHLSENRVEPGDRVTAGQVIALSGNTGRSTAPHLHYQVEKSGKIVDPLDYHGTTRRSLPASAMGDFQRDAARMDATMSQARASL